MTNSNSRLTSDESKSYDDVTSSVEELIFIFRLYFWGHLHKCKAQLKPRVIGT